MEIEHLRSSVSVLILAAALLSFSLLVGQIHLVAAAKPGLRFELYHRDNPASPLHCANLSFSERVSQSLRRSFDQRNAILSAHGFRFGETTSSVMKSRNLLSSNTTYESPVVGRKTEFLSGDYIMELSVGSPPQKFKAILDTGSDLTWVQCKPCAKDQCFKQPDRLFDPAKSKSYHPVKCDSKKCTDLAFTFSCDVPPGGACQYVVSYGDFSRTEGNVSLETITLTTTTGAHVPFDKFVFGCGHQNEGFDQGIDGLVGLGQGPLSFPNQLGSAISNKFSTCFIPFEDRGSKHSEILFGEGAVSSSAKLRYTPFVSFPWKERFSTTPYLVNLTGISVEGKKLDIPFDALQNPGTMVDSGTTFTYMGSGAYGPLVQALKGIIFYPQVNRSSDPDHDFELCYNLSGVQKPKLPGATFHFLDADFEIPPENLFVRIDEAGTLCLAMLNDDAITIIGNYQTQNVRVLYDRHRNRLGFAPAECDA